MNTKVSNTYVIKYILSVGSGQDGRAGCSYQVLSREQLGEVRTAHLGRSLLEEMPEANLLRGNAARRLSSPLRRPMWRQESWMTRASLVKSR